ncbi:MarR family winged helix-turn-helix transcriptional regulator [Streptomyces lavendulae]|uniref:MarR family winged helix-turn-helix transcriptional regulator n=1 Tax=Streptomyces lavendulae TaxID=1914 RepID=UPI0024A52AFF|nr:MarR family winged helix-turn-helix transcriptional regulator [Streptomyces lavendulae]GLW04275.1 MarR family transcriptional regulator [Streptomyces lavendulae subsp. lavendulae]
MTRPAASSPSLPPDDPIGMQSFALLLRRMNAEFHRIAQEFAQVHGLHLTDVQALIAILDAENTPPGQSAGPMTPGRLARHMNLTSGATSACLDRLEAAGHIRRVRAADDRRVVHLHYAEAGRRVAREYFRPLATATDEARSHFTPEQLHTVVDFLARMNRQLEDIRS